MTTITELVARATDADIQTPAERAAALTAAARLGAADLPDPPDGWCWRDDRVVRAEPSGMIPPLQMRKGSWWGERSDEVAEAPMIAAPEPEPVDIPAPAHHEGSPTPYRLPSPWSRSGKVLALIQRDGGATLSEIVAATRLQPHSVKGIISMARRAPGGPSVEYVRAERRWRPAVD